MKDLEYLDASLRLRLAVLDGTQFEQFFLRFLSAGIRLSIRREGRKVTRRVISVNKYGGDGPNDKGVDLRVDVEGPETWCFQCKRRKKWGQTETRNAIKKAEAFEAKHFFLVVACECTAFAVDEIAGHPDWSLWDINRICAEVKLEVPAHKAAAVLSFLEPGELRRVMRTATQALVTPEQYASASSANLRQDWKFVGRKDEVETARTFLEDEGQKAMVVVSTGGEGKSRLLLEIADMIEREFPDKEALFVNPYASDPTDLALHSLEQPVVFIDDAHRLENLRMDVLQTIGGRRWGKVIIATRPQALEALRGRLAETGIKPVMQSDELRLRGMKRYPAPGCAH